MTQARQFTGCAQDYLNWFSLGNEPEQVVLPDTQTNGDGLPANEKDPGLPPMLDYLHRDLGRSYVEQYQAELVEDYKFQRNLESIAPRNKRRETMDDIEEVSKAGSHAEFDEERQNRKTQVYLHYDFSFDQRNTNLPIFKYQKEILEKIENYQVIVIEGETGCGKSTQVPQFILDDARENLKHCNIVVTQPRKIAATSLAHRVCKERNWKLGKIVGYQVGLDNCTDSDTCLAFVTTEVLVQKLIHKRSLNSFTHIILDEVHERDQHTDFALLVVKKLLHSVSNSVKVILMSATIDALKFAQYFATPIKNHMIPAPIVSVSDATVHRIQIFYLDSLSVICKEKPNILPQLPEVNPDDPWIANEMYVLVNEMVKCFDVIERGEKNNEGIAEFTLNRGAVLIFLPGLLEIEQLITCMEKDKARYQWDLYPLHSSITQEEQQKVFCISRPTFRKIILSTNIAESSITVPDIKYVVDFCLTKILTCDVITNYTSLKLAWASKASCKQRAGRSGRVSDGRVYRLVPRGFFETLPSYATPELCRTPLSHVVLKTKILDMGEPRALLALAIDPPNLADINRTILTLKQMGALAIKSKGRECCLDGDLTYLGKVIAMLPVDPHLAKLIVMGHLFGCQREAIIIAAGLSLKSFHARPFQDELNAFLSKVSWAYGSFSDCLALLNAYDLWQSMQLRGEFLRPGACREKEWAKHSYIELKTIREVHKLVQELQDRLEKLKISVFSAENYPKSDQSTILKLCMASAFFPYYYKRNITDDYEKEMNRELSGHDPFTTVVVSGLPSETNILYDDQIRSLFWNCSQNLKISYEGSKAYIQFPRTRSAVNKEEHFQDIPGECPTAMHLALKMRQVPRIQKDLVLKLYSLEDGRAKMAEILGGIVDSNQAEESQENMAGKNILGKGRLRFIKPNECTLRPPVMPSPANHVWRIHVTHVENAACFWAISNETHALKDLNFIQTCINSAISQNKALFLDLDDIVVGQICLAPYKDLECICSFYRARIDEVLKTSEDVKVVVYFVDYGNVETVKASELRIVPKSIQSIPMLAIECMLAEVKPIAKSTMAVWDERANLWLRNRTLNQNFIAQIYSVVHGVVRMHLLPPDGRAEESINETLIRMGYAVRAEEFYLSKQNHQLRAIYSREFDNFFVDDSSSISCSAYSFNSKNLNYSRTKVLLKGPDSPLLLRFVALTRAGHAKGVRIEPLSVNSTALDLEPQNKYDRFVIASFVTLNPSEVDVTLRNTTLMPSIPGLMAVCLLLFCPTAELRVSKDGTHYTGALIGVGADSQTRGSLYPEEDIEIAFDVDFTEDDLLMINQVRFLMNIMIDEGEEMPADKQLRLQKQLRLLVFRLLEKKREFKEPEGYLNAYHWKMISEELLKPDVKGCYGNPGAVVFPLHNGIILQNELTNGKLREDLLELQSLLKRLGAEGTPVVEAVNVECTLCEMFLKTFGNLQAHLASNFHFENEIKLLN
ncbi:ATP-dependent RNA helicase TDRD9 isoform X1 [Macrobrachium rosenbergii]|uniref:ATP-dependent RNA helicase TDRD9 isoform X1 n=2 Tax=Macrobrachium rosenbergii TaxID=79674 RepID=UPI0034D4B3A8